MQGPPRDVPRQEQQILFGYTIVGPNGIIRQPERVITLYPGDQPSTISLGPDENIQGYSVTNSPGQTFFMSITPRMTPIPTSPLPSQPPVVQPPVIQPPVVQPPVIQPLQPPTVPQVPPTTSGQPSLPGQPPSGSVIPWAVWAIGQTNPNIGRVSPEWFLYPYRGSQPRQTGTTGTGQTGGQLPPGVGLGVSAPRTGVFNGRFYPSVSYRPLSSGAAGVFGSRQAPQTYPWGTPYYSPFGEY